MEKKIFLLATALLVVVLSCLSAQEREISASQFSSLCRRATELMDLYGTMPSAIPLDGSEGPQRESITAAEFCFLMASWLVHYQENGCPPRTVHPIRGIEAPSFVETGKKAAVSAQEIFSVSRILHLFVETHRKLPDRVRLTQEIDLSPEAWFYVMGKAIGHYSSCGSFPAEITLKEIDPPHSWTGDASFSAPAENTLGYAWSKTLKVPYEHQPDGYTCGPTSLKMIMAYYGVWKSVGTISTYMKSIGDSPYYDGVAQGTIISSARHYGFGNAYRTTGWTALKNAIAADKPVVAHIQIKANAYPVIYGGGPAYTQYTGGHYVTVVGLGATSDGKVLYVVCNDPSKYGGIKYSGLSFQTAWNYKDAAILVLK